MSGLMRTTSRSESENHFFGQLFNPHLSLIEFLSHFDTAMDSQRFKYGKNTQNSKYTTPEFKTHLEVEKEAAELYTHTLSSMMFRMRYASHCFLVFHSVFNKMIHHILI